MEQRKTFGVLQDIKNGEFRVVLTPPATTTKSENWEPAFAAACRMV